MGHGGSLKKTLHTVRYLKPQQIYYQLRRRLLPGRLVKSTPARPHASQPLALLPGIPRDRKFLGPGHFVFLNREGRWAGAVDWEAPGQSHLWQYNLHYFDYLMQPKLDAASGLALIRNWIDHHPPRAPAVGWEPYPLSLRIVNWIKFLVGRSAIPGEVLASLSLQALNLKRQLEYHLDGNHLWANGKALWFAGIFLNEPPLANLGRHIVLQEIHRQLLPDGGHFELSPMYHAIITEDLLDLINLCRSAAAADEPTLSVLQQAAAKALSWLAAISDSQGNFPLLNDAAYGVAATSSELREYGDRLGVRPSAAAVPELQLGPWSGQNLSGYRIFSHGPFRVLWDTAPLGPDHLPGHAHCDMLSVLLDFEGANILTDTGVSQYDAGDQRRYERSTAAHNTVVLDGLEQAEMWQAFRVGRRGYPQECALLGRSLRCRHTGFAIWRRGLGHERMLTFLDNGLAVTDYVTGPGSHQFRAYCHFAPQVKIEALSGGDFLINQRLLVKSWGAEAKLATSPYCPEFGRVLTRPCLILQGDFRQRHAFGLQFLTTTRGT
jgi:hypothetical protein